MGNSSMNIPRFFLWLWLVCPGVAECWAHQKEINTWDPVFVFHVQWILNAGLPEARLSLAHSPLKAFYLNDGNAIIGKTEIETDSFYVIQVEQDLAEQIPAGENVLVFRRDLRYIK
jgi:hypothetical protein